MRAGRAAVLFAAAAFAPALFGAPAWAQDAPAGDALAGRKVALRICQVCHGANGIARQPDAANLAGQDAGYLVRQLAAFHSGERKNETMAAVSQMLSEQQMRDVAAYYGGIAIEVKSLPGK